MINEYGLMPSDEGRVDEGIKSSCNVISDLIVESFNDLTLTISIILDMQGVIRKLIE